MSIEIVADKYGSAMFELAQEQNNFGTHEGAISEAVHENVHSPIDERQ